MGKNYEMASLSKLFTSLMHETAQSVTIFLTDSHPLEVNA